MESDYPPAHALSDIDASNSAVADRLVTPWWYHPILALALACLALAMGHVTGSFVGTMALTAAAIVAPSALIRTYRRKTGLWIGPAQFGPGSRHLWWLHSALVAISLGVSAAAGLGAWPSGVAYAAAGGIAVATMVLGPMVDTHLRDEIRHGTAMVTR